MCRSERPMAMSSACDQLHINRCLQVLDLYEWLVDSYVVDFFVDDVWHTKMPASWRGPLEHAEPAHLAKLLDVGVDDECDLGMVWPLQLLCLRGLVKMLAANRQPISKPDLLKLLGLSHPVGTAQWVSYEEELSMASRHHRALEHVLRKHVKPKKQHEVSRLSDVVQAVSSACSTSGQHVRSLVDVGSGVGHLARLLSVGHGFNVTCLDAEPELSKTANQFDAQLKRPRGPAGGTGITPPIHLTLRVDPALPLGDFEAAVATSSSSSTISRDTSPSRGLIGLHPCGELGPTLLRLFNHSTMFKFLITVSCCYMKLEKGFPLCPDLFKTSFSLSYSSQELACHAIESFRKRLLNPEEVPKLQVHCYRALLELLIQSERPDLRHSALKSVSRCHLIPFEEYALRATSNLDIQWRDGVLKSALVRHKLAEWRRVLGFYALRSLVAPIIEHVLLLDRVLFLRRHHPRTWLLPVFDPLISPRNLVLISIKN